MVIPGSSAYQVLKVEDIVRCEGLQNYCRVFLESGDIVISTHNLGHYRELLQPFGFLGCHRSHLVNMNHIVRIHKEGSVEMSDDSTVPVSRRMKEPFLSRIREHFVC